MSRTIRFARLPTSLYFDNPEKLDQRLHMVDQRPSTERGQGAGRSSDRLDDALGQIQGGEAFPPGFDARAIARRARRRRRARFGGGALAVVGLVALWGLYDPGLTADYAAGVGHVESVTLPDGTRAQLDSGASMSWSETASERRVRLHAGVVVFETAADPARDFIVESATIQARPVGTVFAVSADDAGWSALVQSGQVQVTLDESEASVLIGAGEAAVRDAGGQALSTVSIDVERALAWRGGFLDFKDEPLSDVIAALDRYKPGRIILLNDQAAAQRFDGVLSLDNIDQALEVVANSSGLELVANWPLIVILH